MILNILNFQKIGPLYDPCFRVPHHIRRGEGSDQSPAKSPIFELQRSILHFATHNLISRNLEVLLKLGVDFGEKFGRISISPYGTQFVDGVGAKCDQ